MSIVGRRRALGALAAAALPAHAQTGGDWPQRPVRIVVAGSGGGAPDLFARHFGEHLARLTGKPVVIENRPGAAGGLAAAAAAGFVDGHTLLWGFSSIFAINPHVYVKLPIDLRRDLVAVASTLKQGLVLVANNDFLARSVADVVRMARAQPDTIAYASYGVAGYPHLAMELLQDEAGMRLVHVPYKERAVFDVIGGQVPMGVEPISTALPLLRERRLRALATTGAQRHAQLPDVPTFAELYPAVGEIAGVHGVWMPAGTPRDVLSRAAEVIGRITELPATLRLLAERSCTPLPGGGDALEALIERESQRWGRVIREKNIKVE